MNRFLILLGFALMFSFIHLDGNLNKYINTKYSYLSITAIVLFALLSLVEFVRFYRQESEKAKAQASANDDSGLESQENGHQEDHAAPDGRHHGHHDHDHDHHGEDDLGHGHSHENKSRWGRAVSYAILFVPILAGIFLPVQTLDSSFVKAKGFAFPQFEATQDNPGQHQFLKPDTSVYYGTEGYAEVKNQDFGEFKDQTDIALNDKNYLKGMEVLYNFPGHFMGRTVSFDGFAYKGEQVDDTHYFVFRFGFIHCAADSGVFGMLAEFPKDTVLSNDQWVRVTGTLTWELYQPFKQTIPVLHVTEWKNIATPEDPYVYRNY
jgi:putative membrane protein